MLGLIKPWVSQCTHIYNSGQGQGQGQGGSGSGSSLGMVGPHALQPSSLLLTHRVADQSHLPVSLECLPRLIDLPQRFTELYASVKAPGQGEDHDQDQDPHFNHDYDYDHPQDQAEDFTDDPAICLITGRMLAAGRKPEKGSEHAAGECTLHSRALGLGVGVFFLVQKCVVMFRGQG